MCINSQSSKGCTKHTSILNYGQVLNHQPLNLTVKTARPIFQQVTLTVRTNPYPLSPTSQPLLLPGPVGGSLKPFP